MRLKGLHGDPRGITPVIGSILILVIMIFAIGGILVWGAPAMAALQEQAQFESIVSQFMQTNSDVRSLWDPQNSKAVAISFKTGQLEFRKGDRWVVSAAKAATGTETSWDGLRLSGWEGSNPTTLSVDGVGANRKITVDIAEGGVFTRVTTCNSPCANPLLLGPAAVCPLPGQAPPVPRRACLDNDAVRIQLIGEDGVTVKGESWIFNAGKLSYRYSDASQRSQVHFEMGAVFTQQDNVFFLQQSPSIKDPDYSPTVGDTNLYVRFIQLTGPDQNRGGSGRFALTFSLLDNYGPSRGRPLFDSPPATMVRLQVNGPLESAFCGTFDAKPGWEQRNLATDANIAGAGDCSGTDATRNVNLFYDRNDASLQGPLPQTLKFHLNQAQVNVIV
jgi:hypothetical protein